MKDNFRLYCEARSLPCPLYSVFTPSTLHTQIEAFVYVEKIKLWNGNPTNEVNGHKASYYCWKTLWWRPSVGCGRHMSIGDPITATRVGVDMKNSVSIVQWGRNVSTGYIWNFSQLRFTNWILITKTEPNKTLGIEHRKTDGGVAKMSKVSIQTG